MKKMTRLKDGSLIGIAALEIEMIPSAENLASDLAAALKSNLAAFAEIVNTAAHSSAQQDTVLELLCVTESIRGQSYEARPILFIVIRKFGRDPARIESRLQSFCTGCAASLQSMSYILKSPEESWQDLQRLVSGIREETALSLEKQIRIGRFYSRGGYLGYTDPYRLEEINNFERIYEALSHCPGMAPRRRTMTRSIITGVSRNHWINLNFFITLCFSGLPERQPWQAAVCGAFCSMRMDLLVWFWLTEQVSFPVTRTVMPCIPGTW